MFGSLFSVNFVSYGRRKTMMCIDILGTIACLLVLVRNVNVLVLSRFIAGFAAGVNSVVVPMYIKEYSPKHLKGIFGSFF